MRNTFGVIILSFLFFSCDFVAPEITYPSPFANSDRGNVKLSMKYPKDINGYYHVPLDPNKSYTYHTIYVEASRITNTRYIYNGISVIEADFDCNSYWIIGPQLSVKIPFYSPFKSLYTSPYFKTPIQVGTQTIILSQYDGQIVPLIQDTGIYLKNYDSRMDEYQPDPNNMWTKRIIGPIPYEMKGDTIVAYGRVYWECGNYTLTYPDRTTIIDSIKIVFE